MTAEVLVSLYSQLRGISYQNNSIVMLEDIGEGDDALLCLTNVTACCQGYDTGESWVYLGTGISPMELGYPVRLLIEYQVRSRTSTEWELGWWYVCTAEEVELKRSTAV